jgi:hypothetical protein
MTLAMSFLILCATHRCSGLIFTGLENFLLFVILAILILFVVNRASVLYEAAIAYVLHFTGFTFAADPAQRFVGCVSTDTFLVDEPALPFRFQRPPPTLSV